MSAAAGKADPPKYIRPEAPTRTDRRGASQHTRNPRLERSRSSALPALNLKPLSGGASQMAKPPRLQNSRTRAPRRCTPRARAVIAALSRGNGSAVGVDRLAPRSPQRHVRIIPLHRITQHMRHGDDQGRKVVAAPHAIDATSPLPQPYLAATVIPGRGISTSTSNRREV